MKIIILCDFFKESKENTASYRVKWLTAREMARKGHVVTFVYPVRGIHIEHESPESNLRLIGVPGILPVIMRRSGFSISDIFCRSLLTIMNLPDVIYVTNGHRPANLIPCLISRLLGNTVIVDETWDWMGKGGYSDKREGLAGRLLATYDRVFEITFKELFDILIVITSELRKRFSGKEKVYVQHGGAEYGALVPFSRNAARSMLGIGQDLFIIGMSSLVRGDHSDNEAFLNALGILCREYNNVFLMVTGSDDSYIKGITEHYGLQGRVIYPGYLEFSEYNKYLSSCDIFVLPYPDTQINRGRWPNKLGDYISLRRPVVTNPTGDVKTLFERYSLGVLCGSSPYDYYDILRKMVDGELNPADMARDAEYVAAHVLAFDKRVESLINIFLDTLRERKTDS
jgi:glycosyltransferase involved in cell wall biosynthesis